MTLREQATAHMVARWKYLGEKGWQGSVTKEQYLAANRFTVTNNIRNGLVPDGKGFYRKE